MSYTNKRKLDVDSNNIDKNVNHGGDEMERFCDLNVEKKIRKQSIKSNIEINDIFGTIISRMKQFELENVRLKQLVNLLLHYRHMLLYSMECADVRKVIDDDLEFTQDLNRCSNLFQKILFPNDDEEIEQSEIFRSIRLKQNRFYDDNRRYCPLNCVDDDGWSLIYSGSNVSNLEIVDDSSNGEITNRLLQKKNEKKKKKKKMVTDEDTSSEKIPKKKKKKLKKSNLAHQYPCEVTGCLQTFQTVQSRIGHMKACHPRQYKTCSVCGKVFSNHTQAIRHLRDFHWKSEFRCEREDCEFVCSLKKELVRHYLNRHPKLRECGYEGCRKVLTTKQYSSHVLQHQGKTKLCSWPDCGKSFSNGRMLKDHHRIHLNYKRYRCKWPGCDYASEQRTNVIKHIRIRHLKLPMTKKQELETNFQVDPMAPKPSEFVEKLPDYDLNVDDELDLDLDQDHTVANLLA